MHLALLDANYEALGVDSTYLGGSGVAQTVRVIYSEAPQLAAGLAEVPVRDAEIILRVRKYQLSETPERGDVVFYADHRYTVDGKTENRFEWFINARL